MRLARFAWSLVSGKNVLAAGRDWVLDPVELGTDLDVFMALVIRRDISDGGVAVDPVDLGRIGLGCIPPTY